MTARAERLAKGEKDLLLPTHARGAEYLAALNEIPD